MSQPSYTNIQPNSLVKYASAVLVSTSGKRNQKDKKKDKNVPANVLNAHTEDILNSILPPREYTMDKQQLWIQSVSSVSGTRQDVIQLQEDLDKFLQQRQARETGICPIREELYAQCFDELIRQITINCAERGLLLVRVRDEIRVTIQAYQTLYESSIAYGMRKTLQAEQKKQEMTQKISSLDSECQQIEKQVLSLEEKIKQIEEDDKNKQERDLKEHQETIEKIKKTNERYKMELEKQLSGSSAAPQPKK
ncbi:hypothetical protein PPERSA_08298 [Pseudocohnilembus persalinus]|uniref:Axonemal dynein light chain n=1 Tax=Pseudocohnilembus persalinus TaxID=266149 RepID=A0A0V0QNX6_PSEPJ|nr:hypothetical protein PPERSA_08298 [Pseudocohnilembus persalinus]|eukprot:KRX04083.1 hypothetical protein PPERSA_08298 [Pseudocohnilembus persalinus]